MSKDLDVPEMIGQYLRAHGYDGLVNTDQECGCSVDDLAPCGQFQTECFSAHRIKVTGGEFDELFFPGHKDTCAECQGDGHSQAES